MSKKVKEKSQLSKRTLVHLDAIKDIYKIDMEKRIITIPLHYSSASDIVAEDIGDKTHPCIKRDLLARFSSIIHNLPDEFKINIDLKIEDYQGYEHSHLKTALMNAFESFQYDYIKQKTTSNLKIVALTIIGITIFALLYYFCAKNLFGSGQESDPTHNTIHEILFSLAGSFLFEDILLLFMPDSGYDGVESYIIYRINIFRFLDKMNNPLTTIDFSSLNNSTNVQTKKEQRIKWLFLICGTIMLTIAAVEVIDIVESFSKIGQMQAAWVICVQSILSFVMFILAGLGTISYYRGKGKLRKIVLPMGFIAAVACAFQIAVSIALFDEIGVRVIKKLVFGSIMLILTTWYIVSAFWLRKKDNEKKVSIQY